MFRVRDLVTLVFVFVDKKEEEKIVEEKHCRLNARRLLLRLPINKVLEGCEENVPAGV